MNIKNEIINELDSRIKKLEQHRGKDSDYHGNEFKNLNASLSNVLGVTLKKELEDIKKFVQRLS